MIRVRFEPAGFEVDAEPGEAIMDITDANPAAEVPYSCRAATCGTCSGDTPDKVRLCCQAKLIGGPTARVTLRVCED
ncbi:MAG: 2Fe-2S iron-sulfur cluster binding domain-containing protein [Deltaproteobacteria bacterium]|nr:2Fe-2S iron-sulfur cluster binding domain-containing protein [Deltaproteobacteria bacterium]